MTYTVHRIDLPIMDRFDAHLPGYVKPLHVAESRSLPGYLEFWYEAETEVADRVDVSITVHGTGNPIWQRTGRGLSEHLGSVVARNGLVWHVYTALTPSLIRREQTA